MLWIVSDKKNDLTSFADDLSSHGYAWKWFTKIADAVNGLLHETPEGILIDADQVEISCFEFCHKIKSDSVLKKTRLIVLSANNSETMEVSAFESGADEFVSKPIRNKALLKRLLVRLDDTVQSMSVFHKGSGNNALQIDKESFSVFLNQVLVPMSRKEFELLHLMASHPGKVFTREEIFSKVWKRIPTAKERTIDVHILRLRKKLGGEFISTQKGVGYRFCA